MRNSSFENEPFSIVKSTNDNCVPKRVHSAAAVVHDTSKPGVDGFGTVAVAISKEFFINPKQTAQGEKKLIFLVAKQLN